ncbi:transmembrane protein 209-like [Anneissia japonica]|uniref:transmembrane protein 209-like n=1 Tax=Anneissia japonica TaxID=1529436 RepID=UPI001425AC3A|nr:transmembrane protein 209-like [Anneissia japonica]
MGEIKFGNTEESSKLNLSINQQRNYHLSQRALIFAFINLLAAILFYFEIKSQYISQLLQFEHPMIWYCECFLATVFIFNMAIDFIRYILFTVDATRNPVELTPEERKIFGVKDKAFGFKTTPTRSRVHSDPTNTSSSSYRRASPSTSYINTSNNDGASFHSRHSVMEGSNSFVSPNVFSNSFVTSYSPTRPTSYSTFSRPPSGSPHTPVSNYSPIYRESSASYLKARHQSTPLPGSPVAMGSDEVITDAASLQSYLKAYEEKERRNQLSSSELSPSGSPSFWTYNRTAADFTPVLRKYQYQLASRSPQSSSSRNDDDDDPDFPATFAANEVWSKVHVSKDMVEEWTANLRKWIFQAILKPLVKEISVINERLTQLGTPELKIGEVSLTSLKQVAHTKAQHLPTLNAVLPYLDISANQEYLVARIRELGAGGSISEFRWNSGGVHKGRKWHQDLPSDSAIVMHLLCSYFNFRLPPHPKYPDGKIFTSKHFMKTPDKPDLKKKDNLFLYQSKINPPHYKLIIGDDTWDLPKGRSNMFQCILLFLHHIKTKEHGMLGRVNLGASGVNILWIIDE